MRAAGPIGYTCPDIDSVKDSITDAISTLQDLVGKNCLLEDLRLANETLRSWGSEMEGERDKAFEEVEEKDRIIADLYYEIKDLKSQLKEIEA